MTQAQRYLEVGDRLLRGGKVRRAAAAYARCADAWIAETFVASARACVGRDPLRALDALARAERMVGPSREARDIAAQAYLGLGQPKIASKFLAAAR
jgi:hypothetical protein